MHWYLVHTKPRLEKCALDNLDRQGYQCYFPTIPFEKLRQGLLTVADEPLFPRYLFIRLGQGDSAKSWAPIRSTKGVSRLVSFGIEPRGWMITYRTVANTRGIGSDRTGATVQDRGACATDGSPICGHRRHLPNGRWRAPGHGADRDSEQACRSARGAGAVCARRVEKPALVIACLAKNLSQSYGGVA